MIFFKKLLLLILVTASMLVTSTTAMSAGKIKNATMAEVQAAIEDTIKNTEEALAALNSGSENTAVLEIIKTAKQSSKRIESPRLGRYLGEAAVKLRKAGSALKTKNGKQADPEKAKEMLTLAVPLYKNILDKFLHF